MLVKVEFTFDGDTEIFDVVRPVYRITINVKWENVCSMNVVELKRDKSEIQVRLK